MSKTTFNLAVPGALALLLAVGAPLSSGIAAPGDEKGPLLRVAQAAETSPDAAVPADELEKLTNEVIRSLKGMNEAETGNAGEEGQMGDLVDTLSTLVEKAMKEGKSSTDVLQLIDEALQKQDGTSLQELMARSGGKLDLQALLDRVVQKAVEKAAMSGADSELARTLEAESRGGETRTVVVRPGDTLGTLAAKYLGDATKWRIIFEANRDRLSDPDLVPAGIRLRIPGGG